MSIKQLFRDVFYNTKPLEERDYEYSRSMSIFEGCAARSVNNLTSGAFLAGYASFLGAGDAVNGIIGAIPVLAGVMSLFSPLYFEKRERRKLGVVLLNFLHRFMMGLMVFIPLIAFNKTTRLLLLTMMYLGAYLAISFSNPAASSLLIDLTPESIRGRYFGKRESILLSVATVISLALGRVMDFYKAGGNAYGGFVVTFAVIILLSFANLYFWSSIKEPPAKSRQTAYKVKEVIAMPLKNAGFKKVIIFFVLYNIALQVGAPFLPVYMVTGLKLDYTYIMLMSTIGTVVNVLLVRTRGKWADKRSWDFTLKCSILLLGITHFSWFFVDVSTAPVLVPVLHVMSGMAWAGIGISTFNIQFIYSPEAGRTAYIGFNAAFGGLMGFLGTMAGSALLTVFHNLKWQISSFQIRGMQILFLISGILLMLCAAYVHVSIRQPAGQT
jgi:MFS family permease